MTAACNSVPVGAQPFPKVVTRYLQPERDLSQSAAVPAAARPIPNRHHIQEKKISRPRAPSTPPLDPNSVKATKPEAPPRVPLNGGASRYIMVLARGPADGIGKHDNFPAPTSVSSTDDCIPGINASLLQAQDARVEAARVQHDMDISQSEMLHMPQALPHFLVWTPHNHRIVACKRTFSIAGGA